jgi:precorrin-6B methylase 1
LSSTDGAGTAAVLLLERRNPPNAVAKYLAKCGFELEERETGLEPATLSLEG